MLQARNQDEERCTLGCMIYA